MRALAYVAGSSLLALALAGCAAEASDVVDEPTLASSTPAALGGNGGNTSVIGLGARGGIAVGDGLTGTLDVSKAIHIADDWHVDPNALRPYSNEPIIPHAAPLYDKDVSSGEGSDVGVGGSK